MGKGKTFSITQEEMERLLDRAADRAVSANILYQMNS